LLKNTTGFISRGRADCFVLDIPFSARVLF